MGRAGRILHRHLVPVGPEEPRGNLGIQSLDECVRCARLRPFQKATGWSATATICALRSGLARRSRKALDTSGTGLVARSDDCYEMT